MPAINDIRQFMTIRNASRNETTLDIDGDIGLSIDWVEMRLKTENTKEYIKSFLKDVPLSAQHRLVVNINSLGGSANDGFSIHDYLAGHPANVVTRITGYSASAATIIAQAASKGKREMSRNAFYLIHRGMNGIFGNAMEMKSMLGDLETFDQRLSELYARRSGRPAEDFLALMNKNNGNGIWLNADEALEYGLIDEIYEPQRSPKPFQNRTEIFNSLGLPELPQPNNPAMPGQNGGQGTQGAGGQNPQNGGGQGGQQNPQNGGQNGGQQDPQNGGQSLQEMFQNFRQELQGMIQNIRNGAQEGGQEEVRILDNEEVQNRLSEMETTISSSVASETHNQVVQARDAAIQERDTAQNRIQELEGQVQNLQSDLAKYSGKPTGLEGGTDPDPVSGGQGKTKNEKAAEQNAAALRTV